MYVLLFSMKGMEAMVKQDPKHANHESYCDNVLLEMRVARELKLRRQEQFRIYPMLLGSYERSDKFQGVMADRGSSP